MVDDEREPLGEGDRGGCKVAVPASIWTRRMKRGSQRRACGEGETWGRC